MSLELYCYGSVKKSISYKFKKHNSPSVTDFSEALSNTTRDIIQPALKLKLNEGEMIIDAGNNPFYVSEHGKDPKNATNQNGGDEINLIKLNDDISF
ncbi:hypothetical protein RclHR1_02950017 [Rhizophagus clarus]|uniref:Uncharacterized protein n=1 Tax=Rhizophagus clarus TaxID=94130 RepID=A0A2Z6RZL1_9GLOM|nr:hypothetical protein RclHR1_02950017 [Rhizophagus clarus]